MACRVRERGEGEPTTWAEGGNAMGEWRLEARSAGEGRTQEGPGVGGKASSGTTKGSGISVRTRGGPGVGGESSSEIAKGSGVSGRTSSARVIGCIYIV